MTDIQNQIDLRVKFIEDLLKESGAKGVVLGNSGGKDSALVAILCRKATKNVLGVIMPCGVKRNFEEDMSDAIALAEKFDLQSLTVDLTGVKNSLLAALGGGITGAASVNIAPRLRMTALYSIAQSKGYLVAGSGNASEIYMGYFTKWGDGAHDFNPIADLTATEVVEMLEFLGAPSAITKKPPSAALAEGQTDESEMGITYKQLDRFLKTGEAEKDVREIIQKQHRITMHKREEIVRFSNTNTNTNTKY